MTKNDVIGFATENGWTFDISKQPNPLMLSFFKKKMRINVYWTTCTVSTALDHPVKGKTQLYRRNVGIEEMKRIFKNPRLHTGKGYFKKPVDHMGEQYDSSRL